MCVCVVRKEGVKVVHGGVPYKSWSKGGRCECLCVRGEVWERSGIGFMLQQGFPIHCQDKILHCFVVACTVL